MSLPLGVQLQPCGGVGGGGGGGGGAGANIDGHFEGQRIPMVFETFLVGSLSFMLQMSPKNSNHLHSFLLFYSSVKILV